LKKVRVFELAKDYGMRGPDLAKLLRDLGFENIKTHMTVLDDADLMMVEARLSAQGLRKQAATEGDAGTAGLPKKKALNAAALEVEDAMDATGLTKHKELKDLPKKALPKVPPKRMPGKGDDDAAPAHKPRLDAAPPSGDADAAPPPAPAPEPKKSLMAASEAPPTPRATAPAAAPAPIQSPAPKPTPKPTLSPAHAAAPAVEPAAAPMPPAKPPARTEPVAPASPTRRETPPASPEPAPQIAAPREPASPPAAAAAAQVAPATPSAPTTRPSMALPRLPANTPPAAPSTGAPAEIDPVKRLLVPQKKATVVGRIELPQETIRDATRRSAPATPQELRRQALQKMQQRTGQRGTTQTGLRRGPAGPGSMGGRGPQRDMGRGGPMGARKQKIISTVDPNRVVEVEEPVSIKALSEALGIKVNELVTALTFKLGLPGKNINSFLSNDEVELVALELDRKIKVVAHREAMDELIEQLVEDSEDVVTMLRAPVVTFMGHVDHGKTSLMDALRQSDVAKHEAGGITQHIGAYKIVDAQDREIVILDTPGHAAFTAMRARGTELTDIVVLVVAGDDGVMPQTEEAISHALAAKVPIVVAITKCDLPGSKPMQVKQQLMIKGLQSEDFGGTTGIVEVSAVTGKGLDELVDRILLEAEILDLRARPDAPGKGIVVESRQSPEQGVVVTLLVTDGTMRLKDQIVCGESFARVRAMIDDHGTNLEEAGPSTPITVFGLDRLPSPGDKLFVVDDVKKAKEVVEERQRRVRELSRAERSAVTLETLSAKLAEKNIREIKLILKADAMGSLEPLKKCLDELATAEVRVNLVHSGLGGINETDVSLAEASGAVIVGFNTVADSSARQNAERAGVEIRYYDVIYELLDQVRAAMEGMLAPQEVQNVVGHAEIKATFKSSKFGTIAGCRITDGYARRSATVRLSREGKVVWSGKIASLRRVEEDVREVKTGFECGMTLEGYQDIKVGDILEFVQIELVKRTLGG
jgi:translation initiation factor IF-2